MKTKINIKKVEYRELCMIIRKISQIKIKNAKRDWSNQQFTTESASEEQKVC